MGNWSCSSANTEMAASLKSLGFSLASLLSSLGIVVLKPIHNLSHRFTFPAPCLSASAPSLHISLHRRVGTVVHIYGVPTVGRRVLFPFGDQFWPLSLFPSILVILVTGWTIPCDVNHIWSGYGLLHIFLNWNSTRSWLICCFYPFFFFHIKLQSFHSLYH